MKNILKLVVVCLVIGILGHRVYTSSEKIPVESPEVMQKNLNEALLKSVKAQNLSAVRAALKLGAEVNLQDDGNKLTPLMWACALGNLSIAKELLDYKAHVDAATPEGWTALMLAAGKGHEEVVQLLGKGIKNSKTRGRYPTANVVAKTEDGLTALMWAALNGHPEVVKVLLACGADCMAKDKDGHDVYYYLKLNSNVQKSRAVMQVIQDHFGIGEI